MYIFGIKRRIRYYGKKELLARREQTRIVTEAYKGYAELEVNHAFPFLQHSFLKGLDTISFLPFEAGDGVSSAALPFRIISCYRTHTSCIVRDGKCEGVGGNFCRGVLFVYCRLCVNRFLHGLRYRIPFLSADNKSRNGRFIFNIRRKTDSRVIFLKKKLQYPIFRILIRKERES